MEQKGQFAAASVIHISDDLSAVENFALLVGVNKNACKLAPVSSVGHGFVSLQLATLGAYKRTV
ncbi:hypothetical protein BGZ65_011980 [Modicella reniformis]|uniref:Uncharacterized protein n=1 Tax=Modicella reniformis TaxID=1440133 RepID=A0A9P6M6Y2_9FUNG|nr:hypothetical protein BGZ65_011980 [Modicella reniformis]